MRLGFLCGAGVSIGAGLPSTAEITRQVLSGEGVAWHNDRSYYFGKPLYAHMGREDQYVPRVCAFLDILKDKSDGFYHVDGSPRDKREYYRDFGRHETNYEDLYYMAAQIYDSTSGEYENPALEPLIDNIRGMEEFKKLCAHRSGDTRDDWDESVLSIESCNYIEWVVSCMLGKNTKGEAGLEIFREASCDPAIESVDVYTLNHDAVLERFFETNGISYADGFGPPNPDVRYWNPDLLDSATQRVRLFKLHGAVNWFRFPSHKADWGSRFVGIPVKGGLWRSRNPNGESQHAVTGRPEMLVGTFNKLLKYTTGIFADLHFRFYRNLEDTDCLVACGYGFGDKAINTRLLDWVYSADSRRCVVIDPGLRDLRWTARGAVRKEWLGLAREGKLRLIGKQIEDVTWPEIKDHMAR
jgi:hypothetical protein